MKVGIIVFPGTNCERDTARAIEAVGSQPRLLWHTATEPLSGCDAVVLPGGFAHGDALRAGAIARFSPIMPRVMEFADSGRPVMGICNGFQVLVECGLLPGALLRNDSLQFRAEWVHCRVEAPVWGLQPGAMLRLPVAHGMGNYFPDASVPKPDVVLRYCDAHGRVTPQSNPNGSFDNIAGISNGNVLGLMPHPERAISDVLGSVDGSYVFQALVRELVAA
ncbi:MAG TPA: phosphoribosylformylglycinamidine synthase I [Chloroflexota bacterium]|nr:phosphoribosylformylglycinamidine synthase I [Chloroflexota bacterium]